MRGDIAVIGDSDSIIGFKAVGFRTFAVKDAAEVITCVENLVREKYFVIFITEQALTGAASVLETYRDLSIPVIIPIPGRFGLTGMGMKNLSKNVERALGADILGLNTPGADEVLKEEL
jgi:V/A-type H+-transporting ATPase subunit F